MHCVKSFRIRSISGPNAGKSGQMDTFYAVIYICGYQRKQKIKFEVADKFFFLVLFLKCLGFS